MGVEFGVGVLGGEEAFLVGQDATHTNKLHRKSLNSPVKELFMRY